MNSNLIIKKEREIKAGTKTVWGILTETTSEWNGVSIETKSEWKPNSEIIFSFVWDGTQYSDKGKIINFESNAV
jgi:hypothetical protein